jgi:hypothetical protein
MVRSFIFVLLLMSILPGCKTCEWQQAACMPCPYSRPYFGEYNYMPVPIPVTLGSCPAGTLESAAPLEPRTIPAVPPAPAAEELLPSPAVMPVQPSEMMAPTAPPQFLPPISVPAPAK